MSEQNQNLKPRPPIVVVMGHVDHGKTSLLDYIRKTNIAAREAGGITQAIGAYEVKHRASNTEQIRGITFIDTPGHEAFTAMRSRGAKIADLAVLVVAADDGVKPQTKEAIAILKETKTPFIVAINKIDKTGGDVEKAKNELMAAEVFLEGFGGQTSYHGISAKTGEGVNELLDLIILAADLEGLTYEQSLPASGYVLEARHDRQRGIEATLILRNGTIRRGEEIFTPTTQGKVKILENFLGEMVDELEPSAPAIFVGLESLPHAGEEFLAGKRPEAARKNDLAERTARKPGKNTFNLILKSSDAGSLEAFSAVIKTLGKESHPLYIVEESVGDITDGDIKNASATGAVIIGFKNRVDRAAKNLAEGRNVKVITGDIVYDLVKIVEDFLAEAGEPKTIGELEVLAVFSQKKLSEQLVGGRVTHGVFRNKASFEIVRAVEGAEQIFGKGRVLSMREGKTSISEAKEGTEAGVLVNAPVKIEVGDKLKINK